MNISIDFYSQMFFMTVKIKYISINRMLTSELTTCNLLTLQPLP